MRFLLFFIFFLNFFITEQNSKAHEEKFSIYCLSNLDNTGTCTDANNQKIICSMSTHKNLKCERKVLTKYNCLQYGKILSKQSQFICEKKIDSSYNKESNKKLYSPSKKETNNTKQILVDNDKKTIKEIYEESYFNENESKIKIDTSVY